MMLKLKSSPRLLLNLHCLRHTVPSFQVAVPVRLTDLHPDHLRFSPAVVSVPKGGSLLIPHL